MSHLMVRHTVTSSWILWTFYTRH